MLDKQYMQRCLDLAINGQSSVSPNPMVGCVIVYENRIIGEGYHQKFGEAHAEVNAISNVLSTCGNNASDWLKESTVYVNLEPCSHFGKTPPCVNLLIQYQVKRVVIANTDPNHSVNGRGIKKLQEAGIEVVKGVLESEGKWLNRRFFMRNTQQRPYIILKWAQTQDGFFAPKSNEQKWISGVEAKILTHQWRSEEDAILIGKNTALIDNPQLNVREVEGRSPIKILIDRKLSIPSHYQLFEGKVKTIIFNEIKTEVIGHLHYIFIEDMQFYLVQKIAYQLFILDIQSVIVEGGLEILNQFINAKLWDEARVFTSNTNWHDGLKAPLFNAEKLEELKIGNDTLSIFIPNKI